MTTKRLTSYICLFAIMGSLLPAGIVGGGGIFHLAGVVISDIGAADQWHLSKIRADEAWEITEGSGKVVVAVIDTGLDFNHPDLQNNIWTNSDETPGDRIDNDGNGFIDDVYGWDFVEKDNTPSPNLDGSYDKTAVHHGTFVAGLIAAEGNNAFGGAGVGWRTKIMPLKAFDEQGESDTFLVAGAIDYAIKERADIINMSFVGFGYSSHLAEKIKAAYDAGILLVAASGSENGVGPGHSLNEKKSYPVCFSGPSGENYVLGVAALDSDDIKTGFSNYGSDCVDIAAPGKEIYSTLYHNSGKEEFLRYFGGTLSGTSMAAPQVAGAAALIKAVHPNYTNKELTQALLASTDDISGKNPDYIGQLGSGRLNVLKAVSAKTILTEPAEEAAVKFVLSAGPSAASKLWYLNSKGDIIRTVNAYQAPIKGGVGAAVADLDGDGRAEAVSGAGAGGGPHIKIFNLNGQLKKEFFAFAGNERSGVEVATGNVRGDGKREIIVFGKNKANWEIRIFDDAGKYLKSAGLGRIKYGELAVGDITRDGLDEIIFWNGSALLIIDGEGNVIKTVKILKSPAPANIAVGDLNGDGWHDIILSRGGAIYTYNMEGRLLSPAARPFGKYGGEIMIGAGDKDGDGAYEIIAGANIGGKLEIKILDGAMKSKMSFRLAGKDFKTGAGVYIITR